MLYLYVFGHYLRHDSDFYIIVMRCVDNATLPWKSQDWALL
jgi:hypothetical protein